MTRPAVGPRPSERREAAGPGRRQGQPRAPGIEALHRARRGGLDHQIGAAGRNQHPVVGSRQRRRVPERHDGLRLNREGGQGRDAEPPGQCSRDGGDRQDAGEREAGQAGGCPADCASPAAGANAAIPAALRRGHQSSTTPANPRLRCGPFERSGLS